MTEARDEERGRRAGWGVRSGILAVAVLSFVPLADWIPGEPGSNLPPPLWPLYLLWALGFLVLGGVAWVGVRLRARLDKGSREEEKGRPSARVGERRRRSRRKADAGRGAEGLQEDRERKFRDGPWVPALLFLLPLLLYSFTTWEVFDARPLHIDAMTQALQAHVFTDGRLSVPVADDPRFFSSALLVEHEGRAFSQFPPGWSLLLGLGFLVGLSWLVPPLLGALAVAGFHRLLRENDEPSGTAMAAALLFGLSPWIAFNAASWMSHVPTLAVLLLGSAALVRGIRRPEAWGASLLAGGLLGAATLIRPLEAVAFGIPATVWVVHRGLREPAARKTVAAFAAGGAVAMAVLLSYNALQHGSPMLFGFELQWGPEHALGFHEAPWGPPHTFLRGLQLINGYLLALQLLFFDAPVPSLLLAFAALLLVKRLDELDRYLLSACALVLLGYLAFWGEGHDLGPRYIIPLAPVAALWTVRFGRILEERTGRVDHRRWGHAVVVLLLLGGWLFGTPTRWFVYGASDPLRRVDVGALKTLQARDALVFVSSPWSIQVQARLRATGMSRQEAQWFYYRVGLCRLDIALAQLEDRGVTDPGAVAAALRPLAADSAAMVLDPLSGSPGDPYTGLGAENEAALEHCRLRQELEETQGGYMILPFQARLGPTWLEDGPIVAQDLHEENRRLLAAYPDRDAYALRPVRIRGRVREFRLTPLRPDSVEAVWESFRRLQREAEIF